MKEKHYKCKKCGELIGILGVYLFPFLHRCCNEKLSDLRWGEWLPVPENKTYCIRLYDGYYSSKNQDTIIQLEHLIKLKILGLIIIFFIFIMFLVTNIFNILLIKGMI